MESDDDELKAIWDASAEAQRDIGPVDSQTAFKALEGRMATPTPRIQPRRSLWGSLAPGMAVVLFTFGLLLYGRMTHRDNIGRTYATVPGQRMSITLSDGTRVTLAPQSRLQLADNYGYSDSPRGVILDGEAYFTVVHDTQHPFSVSTHNVTVTDVGTEFDVQAYDANVRVVVSRGSVVVGAGQGPGEAQARPARASPNGNPPSLQDIPLSAGDVFAMSASGPIVTHHADISAMIAWQQGQLVFRNMPMVDVVRELDRTFDVDITITDSTLSTLNVNGSFTDEAIGTILDEITTVAGAEYQRAGRKITIRRATKSHPPVTTVLTRAS